jgi:DNA-binding CsgD family transcriptional regulator
MRGPWADAMEVARALAPASEWRVELARRLRIAVDGNFAAVMTCAPGDWSRLKHDADPADLGHLVERIQREFIPRIERAGEDWRFALRTHGPVYAPLETARNQPLACELREEVLQPVGIDGYLTAFFTIGDPPRIVGLTAIGAGDRTEALLERAAVPLHQIARAASATLGSALALAEGCFARPGEPALLAELTARERQIAMLSAQGFANVNVAAQLGISEATVAVHLRRIYAKLGVHSRVELAAAVGLMPAARPR